MSPLQKGEDMGVSKLIMSMSVIYRPLIRVIIAALVQYMVYEACALIYLTPYTMRQEKKAN